MRIEVFHHIILPDAVLPFAKIFDKLDLITKNQSQIMSQVDELNGQLTGLQTSVDALQERVKQHEDKDAATIAAQEKLIADLQEKLASGATAEDVAGFIATAQAIKADVESDLPAVVPEPSPAPGPDVTEQTEESFGG